MYLRYYRIRSRPGGNMTTIATVIDRKMREKKLTTRLLSEKIGVHPQTVQWWRNGRRIPRAEYILPLSAALDLPVETLLSSTN